MTPQEQDSAEKEIEQMLWELCQPLDQKDELSIDILQSNKHPASTQESPITIFKINKHLLNENNMSAEGTEGARTFAGHKLWEWIVKDPEKAKKTIAHSIKEHIEGVGIREIIFTDLPNPKIKQTTKLKISEIDQHHLGQTFIFEGMIKNKTEKLVRDQLILWRCPECGKEQTQEITIEQTLNGEKPETQRKACYDCVQKHGKPRFMRPLIARKTTFLTVTLQDEQDSPEQETRTKQVIFDGTLSNEGFKRQLIKGRKIRILATITQIHNKEKMTTYTIVLHAQGLHEDMEQDNILPLSNTETEELIKQSQPEGGLISYWSKRLYTSLHGYTNIKESLIIQMVGTNQKQIGNKKNKTTINILLIGDAGAGKSTFLVLTTKYALKTRYANASSSSGVGITASVTKNELTGTNMIDAGAIPLTNNGLLCLDEIDKIAEDEIKKLHEAMTENTITINKAGCHETLPANTSILGAGNPEKGIFDEYKSLEQQITIPVTIVNRFELIYLIRDKANEEEDLKKVTKMLNNQIAQEKEPIEEFKRYLKTTQKIEATIPEELKNHIGEFYIKIRKSANGKKIILNTRSVENIIRLIQAHAKAELRSIATQEDLEWATRTYIEGIGAIATDSITGEIDVTKIETGLSKNERSVTQIILDLLEDGQEHSFTDIRSLLSEEIKMKQLDDLLQKMKETGYIFEPRNGSYKIMR